MHFTGEDGSDGWLNRGEYRQNSFCSKQIEVFLAVLGTVRSTVLRFKLKNLSIQDHIHSAILNNLNTARCDNHQRGPIQ